MQYYVLACDYDGTIATNGVLDPNTVAALRKVTESGRRVVLVTGRDLGDLQRVLPDLSSFHWVVAENGGVLYRPDTKEEQLLAPEPSSELVSLLREQNVEPLSVGRTIIATWEPHQTVVLNAIRELGLELQVIFNKGAVMVLPASVNKRSGLAALLAKLCISPHNCVGIGDAENDHAFLGLCEYSAAVSNALPALKQSVDEESESSDSADPLFLWQRDDPETVRRVRLLASVSTQRRHRRKYAQGELGPDKSFYFRGVDGRLNLRAQNLVTFNELGAGVDDETWLFHLARGDYSNWIREAIKDEPLAEKVAEVEKSSSSSAEESRARVRELIESVYTTPA